MTTQAFKVGQSFKMSSGAFSDFCCSEPHLVLRDFTMKDIVAAVAAREHCSFTDVAEIQSETLSILVDQGFLRAPLSGGQVVHLGDYQLDSQFL